MKLTCPRCEGQTRFEVTAHEVHDWIVDEDGDFVEDKGCTEMSHKPDSQDVYSCVNCGADAKVE